MPLEAGADAWAILTLAISSRAEDDPPQIDLKGDEIFDHF